jgi:hypothetical protein
MNQNLDDAAFYVMILDTLNELLDRATAYGEPLDILQLDICGDSMQNTVYLISPNGEADLGQFIATCSVKYIRHN